MTQKVEWLNPMDNKPLLENGHKDFDGDCEYEFWESVPVLLEFADGKIMYGMYEEEIITQEEDDGTQNETVKRIKEWAVYTEDGVEDVDFKDIVAWMPLPQPCRGDFNERVSDPE